MNAQTKAANEVVAHLGGVDATAKALGLSYHCVYYWVTSGSGIPAKRLTSVSEATQGKFSPADLRPDIFTQLTINA